MKKVQSLIILLIVLILGTACSLGVEETFTAEDVPPAPEPTRVASVSSTPLPATATTAPTMTPPTLPVIGPAPEWQNETWINTESPLRVADLQGKVVLLEFWTFG